jgi:hypothetical protein
LRARAAGGAARLRAARLLLRRNDFLFMGAMFDQT